MFSPGAPGAFFARVERGTPRCYAPAEGGPRGFVRTWDAVGAARFAVEPCEEPQGHLVNHLLTLHLSGEAVLDLGLPGRDWESHRVAHHGVGLWPAAYEHAVRTHQPADVLFVELAPGFVESTLLDAHASAPVLPVVGGEDPFVEHVLLALASEAKADTPTAAARVEKLASVLLAHLAEHPLRGAPPLAPASSLPSPKLRRVLDHISGNLDAALTLQRLAELADMDVFRFTRAFKQSTGSSPHRYVLEARIARAKELLANRALSITDVALQTGFATPSHFSVTFRRITALTPRAFRDGLK